MGAHSGSTPSLIGGSEASQLRSSGVSVKCSTLRWVCIGTVGSFGQGTADRSVDSPTFTTVTDSIGHVLRTATTTATLNRELTHKLFFKIDLPCDGMAMLPPMRHAHFS